MNDVVRNEIGMNYAEFHSDWEEQFLFWKMWTNQLSEWQSNKQRWSNSCRSLDIFHAQTLTHSLTHSHHHFATDSINYKPQPFPFKRFYFMPFEINFEPIFSGLESDANASLIANSWKFWRFQLEFLEDFCKSSVFQKFHQFFFSWCLKRQ